MSRLSVMSGPSRATRGLAVTATLVALLGLVAAQPASAHTPTNDGAKHLIRSSAATSASAHGDAKTMARVHKSHEPRPQGAVPPLLVQPPRGRQLWLLNRPMAHAHRVTPATLPTRTVNPRTGRPLPLRTHHRAVVARGATLTADDLSASTGDITGTVRDADTHAPIDGVCVTAFAIPSPSSYGDCTGSDGTFDIGGVPAGTYDVSFVDNVKSHVTQWWNNVSPLGSPTQVVVAAGQTVSGIDANMREGGSISGHVTDSSGNPLANICITVYATVNSQQAVEGGACTDASGNYQTSGLAVGSYIIGFSDAGGTYAEEFYDGVNGRDNTDTLIEVVKGSVTPGINAALATGGSVSGTVTDDTTHVGIPDVCVEIEPRGTTASNGGEACTDGSGHYRVGGLGVGTYVAEFFDESGSGYISQFPNTLINVAQGASTGGVDAAMSLGGEISGTLTNAVTTAPAAGVCVVAVDSNDDDQTSACSDATGVYHLRGLLADPYTVEFADTRSSAYVAQFYSNAATQGTATPVTVNLRSNLTGVNAVLQPGGTITGTITDALTGLPVSDLCVEANNNALGQGGGCEPGDDDPHFAFSNSSGVFTITGLATGIDVVVFNADVDFEANGYNGPVYYQNNPNPSVRVNSAQTTSLTNELMPSQGDITGIVTDASTGLPIPNYCGVEVNGLTASDQQSDIFTTCTDSAGRYYSRGQLTGPYEVFFSGQGPYEPAYFSNSPTEAGETKVSVTSGALTSLIDEALVVGGTITGTVTDASTGLPAARDCDIAAISAVDQSFLGSACTQADGTYQLAGLPAGPVKVEFGPATAADGTSTYIAQWDDNQPSSATAATITVSLGQTVGGIDAALQATGSINGLVRDATTHALLPNICVYAFLASDTTNGDQVGQTCTTQYGAYEIDDLPPGSYIVKFSGGGYPDQYYQGSSTVGGATPVTVGSYLIAGGIDEAMAATVSHAVTVSVSSDTNPAVTGQSMTLTASVSPVGGSTTPTGTVEFAADGTDIPGCGASLLTGGVATCSVSAGLLAGSHHIVASYSGDTSFTAGDSSATPLVEVVHAASTALSLTADNNPVVSGQPVTFTATVAVNLPGSTADGAPTGTVAFRANGANLPGCSAAAIDETGTAECTVAAGFAVSTQTIAATYTGDANFTGSAATSLSEQVGADPTMLNVVASANPPVAGQGVVYTAQVSAVGPGTGTPTGSVTFTVTGPKKPFPTCTAGNTVALSSGTASCAIPASKLTVGSTYSVTVTYTGSTQFLASSGSLSQTIAQGGATVSVTSSANPSVSGAAVTLTAAVAATSPAGGTPTGTVTWSIVGTDGSVVTCNTADTVKVAAGSAKCVIAKGALFAADAPYSVMASYSGSTSFTPAVGSFSQQLTKAPTKLKLQSSAARTSPGVAVTFTATVTPTPASSIPLSGSVTFTVTDGFGHAVLCPGSGAGSTAGSGNGDFVATCTVASGVLLFANSPYQVVATYSGDGSDASSTATATHTVSKH